MMWDLGPNPDKLKQILEGKPGLSVQESQMLKDYGRNQSSLEASAVDVKTANYVCGPNAYSKVR